MRTVTRQKPRATEVIRAVKKLRKLISMDIAEINPRDDQDNRTARLAAILIHQVSIETQNQTPHVSKADNYSKDQISNC